MTFVIKMLELHQGNISFGIQIGGNPAHMFEMVHCNLQQTDALMSPACWLQQMQCAE
jgi:hypothetical protein